MLGSYKLKQVLKYLPGVLVTIFGVRRLLLRNLLLMFLNHSLQHFTDF